MPGIFDREEDDSHRPAILKELDSFNDAPGFGALGILAQELGDQEDAQQQPDTAATEDRKEDKAVEPDYEKVYAPLNSSIQELGARMDNRLSHVERIAMQRQQQQPPAPQPQYDPEEPVYRGHYEQRQQSYESLAQQNAMDNAYLRAQLSLSEFNRLHPESKITANDLEQTWNQAIQTGSMDLQKARSVNWTALFTTQYHQQVMPEREKEVAQLRKENEELRKQVSKKSAGSNQHRQEQLSPAVARAASTRSIESPTNYQGGDEDVTHLPSFKRGKSFRSFANELKRAKGLNY